MFSDNGRAPAAATQRGFLTREELERYFELSTDLMGAMSAADWRWARVNPAFSRILGWRRDELVDTSYFDLLHRGDVDAARSATCSLTDRSLLAQFEVRVRCRDGGYRRVAWQVWRGDGEDLLYCAGHDMTDRRSNERALSLSQARTDDVLEAVRDAFISVDFHCRCTYVNAAAERLLGLNRDALLGGDVRALPIDGALAPVFQRAAEVLVGAAAATEQEHLSALGLWLEVRYLPTAQGVSIFCRDIGERMRLESQMARVRDELERRVAERTAQLQQRASQLARMASHITLAEQRERRRLAQVLHNDVQQLLVGAKFGVDVLRRRVPADRVAAVERVGRLLDESIGASRSLSVELSPPILHEAGLAAGLEWLARWMKETHGLQVDLRAELRATTQREDVRALLFQAVRELLLNVVKHAGVTAARIELAAHDAGYLRVTVCDSGRGFDSERLGGMAHRAGKGIGLFTIRERLAMLGGSIEIHSAAGEGARFVLIAPMHVEAAPAVPHVGDANAAMERRATPDAPAPSGGGIRILLVDDHEVVRQGLMSLLAEEPDFRVVAEAADGVEAIEQVRQVAPDVVLMDFSMPGMDGVAATRRLREEFPGVRVIGLSMYQEPDRSAAMLEAGAVAYLTKSGESNLLIETIRNVHRGPPAGASR